MPVPPAAGGSDASAVTDGGRLNPDASRVRFVSCDGKSCAESERLNEWTGRCQASEIPYPSSGKDNGEDCAADTECRSAGAACSETMPSCVQQSGGGYCTSTCTAPADYFGGPVLQRSDCPQGSICLPMRYAPAGRGQCLRECSKDTDCRTADGYYCRRTFTMSPDSTLIFDNGYCAPLHCKSRGCSEYYHCDC